MSTSITTPLIKLKVLTMTWEKGSQKFNNKQPPPPRYIYMLTLNLQSFKLMIQPKDIESETKCH